MGLVCTGENFHFPRETELSLRGRHLRCLAALLNICIHRYTTFPPPNIFFHTYNEELQKTSQIKVPYFTFNMFSETKQSCNLGILCCADPALTTTALQHPNVHPMRHSRRRYSHLPGPTHSRRLDLEMAIPKNPFKGAQSGSAAGEQTPHHHLTTANGIVWSNKKGGRKKSKENTKPEAKL